MKRIIKILIGRAINKKIKQLKKQKRIAYKSDSQQVKATIFVNNEKIDFAIKTLNELIK